MGMSASQMRYAMLTGRKSDVQFQGQQINQQRTTLATETSAYNAQLLDLVVPTPPSTSDYTTTNYTYTNDANGLKYTIVGTNVVDAANAKYNIDVTYDTTGNKVMSGLDTYFKTVTNGVTSYHTGTSSTPIALTSIDLNAEDATVKAQDQSNLKTIYGNNYNQSAGAYYKYTVDGKTRYIDVNALDNAATNNTQGTFKYIQPNSTITESTTLENATIQWSSSGRMNSITVTNPDNTTKTYTLSVTSTTNDSAYTDAYNEYEYQKQQYTDEVNKINSQIDVVESEDKKLELKLKDLDTQNNALNTEMDSVKKVIDKNIEQSFKAFA